MQQLFPDKKIIWVESLYSLDLLFLIPRVFFTDCIIYYDEHQISKLCIRLINLLKRIKLCSNYYPAKLSFDIKDYRGNALSYSTYEELRICVDKFCDQYISDKTQNIKEMVKTYISFYILPQITFIKMVESKISFQYQSNILYLKRRPFSFILVNYYKRKFQIENSFNYSEIIRLFLKPFFFLFIAIVSKVLPREMKTNISQIKPSIWVEYSYNDVANFIFWRDSVNQKDFDIVYYLDRDDTPLLTKAIDDINNKGINWIDAHSYPIVRATDFNWKTIGNLLSKLFSIKFKYPLCYRVFMFEYVFWFGIYKSIFKHFKVKILIQHQNCFWKQGVQVDALESVGGIMIGFNWSYYHHNIWPRLMHPDHVFFVWGELNYSLFKKNNICRYILPSGLWILADNNKNITQQSFIFDKLSFIISIFDNSISYNIHQTPDTLSRFYLKILQLLEDNPSWGVIVKSKNWSLEGLYSLPEGKEIVQRLKSLIEEKRAIVLEPTVSPAIAATYTNLSVCYGLNSAGVITGIHGHKTIHWDCAGWLKNSFYKDPNQHFIYSTLDELEDAIIKVANGDKTIGDFSKWRQKLNYFDDFKAPERVGRFIQTFMAEVIKTDNMEYSLDFAVKRYIEENKIGEDFFKPEDWWDE